LSEEAQRMSLQGRIIKLEEAAKAKTGGVLKLYDSDGNEVCGVVLKKPVAGEDGLAVLPDGTQMPIAQNENCADMVLFTDNLPKNKLLLRRGGCTIFHGIEAGYFLNGN